MTPFILTCGIILFLCGLLIYVQSCRIQHELEDANERVAELEARLRMKEHDAILREKSLLRIEDCVENLHHIIDRAKSGVDPDDSGWKSSVTRIKIVP